MKKQGDCYNTSRCETSCSSFGMELVIQKTYLLFFPPIRYLKGLLQTLKVRTLPLSKLVARVTDVYLESTLGSDLFAGV